MKKACDLGVGGSDRDQLHWLQNSLWAALIRMLDLDSLSQREPNFPTTFSSFSGSCLSVPRLLAAEGEGCWVCRDCHLLPSCPSGANLPWKPSHPSAVRKGLSPAALVRLPFPLSVLSVLGPKAGRGEGGLGPLEGGCQCG